MSDLIEKQPGDEQTRPQAEFDGVSVARGLPNLPGVYRFLGGEEEVLYVGKAKSLRRRLGNYFGADVRGKTASLVDAAASVDWIVTPSEVAAIMTEFSLVQEHQPRFNIRLRDDKSFPYLALTVSQEWPRAMVVRGKRRKGTRYFGPYAHAYAIRQTLDLMLRTFPIRTCTDAKYRRHESTGRPCLLFHIEKCAGPCVGEIDAGHGAFETGARRHQQGIFTDPAVFEPEPAVDFLRSAWSRGTA